MRSHMSHNILGGPDDGSDIPDTVPRQGKGGMRRTSSSGMKDIMAHSDVKWQDDGAAPEKKKNANVACPPQQSPANPATAHMQRTAGKASNQQTFSVFSSAGCDSDTPAPRPGKAPGGPHATSSMGAIMSWGGAAESHAPVSKPAVAAVSPPSPTAAAAAPKVSRRGGAGASRDGGNIISW